MWDFFSVVFLGKATGIFAELFARPLLWLVMHRRSRIAGLICATYSS